MGESALPIWGIWPSEREAKEQGQAKARVGQFFYGKCHVNSPLFVCKRTSCPVNSSNKNSHKDRLRRGAQPSWRVLKNTGITRRAASAAVCF
jgi:hypothetical protein